LLNEYFGLDRTFVQKNVTPEAPDCPFGDLCLDVGPRELLRNYRRSLIDPDTLESAMSRTSADGKPMKLVVSVGIGMNSANTLTGVVLG
jgi:hypothetical protein